MRQYLQQFEREALDQAIANLRKTPNSPGSSSFVGGAMLTVVPDKVGGGVSWELKGRSAPMTTVTGHVGRAKAKA